MMVSDDAGSPFIRKNVTNDASLPKVSSFLNLTVTPNKLEAPEARDLMASHDWPQPASGKVFLCALNGSGV